jgi:polyisoprenoid-binding protein YceI
MQDHFNEEYIESDKYPNARFSGTYTGDVDVTKDGTYNVQAQGQLTLHGVTKPIEVPAVIEVKDGKLVGKSDFKLTPSDFNIKIPSLVREKIAQQIDVHVSIDCSAIK